MFKKSIVVIALTLSSLVAGTINIALSANVSYAIDSLKEEFHKAYPDTKVRVTLGSSGKLTAQIKHGAPYDVFLSANMLYPSLLYKEGQAITKPVIYAKGSLVLLSRKDRDFKDGLVTILNNKIRRIAIANPKTAPYGKATFTALKNAKLYNDSRKKFIYAESASQTLSYTMSVTDVGFVAKSSLFKSQLLGLKEGINWIDVDATLYKPIEQGIVLLKHSKNAKESRAFYDFILSEKAKNILKEYGYIVR